MRSVYPNGDLASIAGGDLAIFHRKCRGDIGDGLDQGMRRLLMTCSEGVDVGFECRWWWHVLEELRIVKSALRMRRALMIYTSANSGSISARCGSPALKAMVSEVKDRA